MDFLRLNFLDAKLPARCFLGPAKGGCLPPSGTQIFDLSAGLRLKTKGTKKTLEPLVKSIQKDQAEKHKKSARCVGEPRFLSPPVKRDFHVLLLNGMISGKG
jgi:hypothetical protein